MTNVIGLYDYAANNRIDVYWFPLDRAESLSAMDKDGACYIAMDPWCLRTLSEEKTKLGHEIGHCATGSFYNENAALDIRRKHENRADKWAIKKLVPKRELDAAVADGCTELWDLAERFGVTEDFMRKAVCWYRYGNLAVEEYMGA